MEKDRDKNGRLLRWYTGNRIVYIEVPSKPLPRQLQMSSYRASLYHREQKINNTNTAVCSRCLQTGHRVTSCEAVDVVCRMYRLSGHKAGDPLCIGPIDTLPITTNTALLADFYIPSYT